jgi:hypothetical protein
LLLLLLRIVELGNSVQRKFLKKDELTSAEPKKQQMVRLQGTTTKKNRVDISLQAKKTRKKKNKTGINQCKFFFHSAGSQTAADCEPELRLL